MIRRHKKRQQTDPEQLTRRGISDAAFAALALAEVATRLSDRTDSVPDEVWNQAARHYDEPVLASLILTIGMVNYGNRVNLATKQQAGECDWSKPRS